jgi:hypothetical protein
VAAWQSPAASGIASGQPSRASENLVQLISGPPRDTVFGWAHDFAEAAVQIYQLPQPDTPEREQALAKMKAAGDPVSVDEMVDLAASTVIRHGLGWYRRNQFYGSLQGFCVLMGMPRPDAIYLAGLVQAKVRQGAAA